MIKKEREFTLVDCDMLTATLEYIDDDGNKQSIVLRKGERIMITYILDKV